MSLQGTERLKSSLPERRTNKDMKFLQYLRVASFRCEQAYWEKVSHGNCILPCQPWMTGRMGTKLPGEGFIRGGDWQRQEKFLNKN